MAEFAYNNSVNKSTGLSPFEIVSGCNPKIPIDVLPISIGDRPSTSVESFAKHLQDLHIEIRRKIASSYDNYKSSAYLHRRLKEFTVGDEIMLRVLPERFPRGAVKKLHIRDTGPFRVLRRIGSNAYELGIPTHIGIGLVFNVEDLTPYHQPVDYPSQISDSAMSQPASHPVPPTPPMLSHRHPAAKIDDIMDDEILSTTDGGYQCYMVHWRRRHDSDDTWLRTEDIDILNADILDVYYRRHSLEANVSKPARVDGNHGWKTYQKRQKKTTLITFD